MHWKHAGEEEGGSAGEFRVDCGGGVFEGGGEVSGVVSGRWFFSFFGFSFLLALFFLDFSAMIMIMITFGYDYDYDYGLSVMIMIIFRL